MDYQDIRYEVSDHVATITLDRPEVMNAFRGRTCEELIHALGRAGYDRDIGAIVLTGAGERAFCTGGDQSSHDEGGGYGGGRGVLGMPIDEVHTMMRDVPKPVVAKVRGYAIGGGNVLATVCDLTVAAESAIFGQVGPKMGSVDPGFGTAYLARVIGEKRAREMWFLCRRYSAAEAREMGLVNAVVPEDRLDDEVD
jgi:2-ketocyclohexanecarboxyl-CoA hydrolase